MAKYRVPNTLGFEWQKPVLDKDLTAPPSSPSNGDRYIVASGATGDWSGHDGEIAWYENGVWYFIPKKEGMFVYVKDEDKLYYYNGSSWQEFASGSGGSDSDWVIGNGVIYNLNDKVGIGTDSPSEALEVNGNLKITGDWYWFPFKNFRLFPSADNSEWSFDLKNQDSYSGCYWHVWSDKDGGHSILVVRGDTLNVGIGKINPNPQAKLDVNGDVYFGSYSKSTNGYTKLPNGLILQWGVVDFNDQSLSQSSYNSNVYYTSETVTFPISFPNQLLSVVAQVQDAPGPGRQELVNVWDVSNNGFNIEWQMLGNDRFPQSGKFLAYWIAIGY